MIPDDPTPPADAPHRIPAERYFSQAWWEREWERMWSRVWLLAADLADVARPGDHATFDFGPESIVVARGAAGEVRAFFNVCQHRGNRLCHAPRGHAMRLTCPYHHWQWELDGRLARVPDRHEFPGGAPERDLSLREVACETWGGFAWVNLARDPEPLREYLGPIAEQLDRYPLAAYTRVHQTSVEIPCNWKTWVDAVNEAYHVHTSHPQLLPLLDDVHVEIELYERHSRHVVPFGAPSPRLGSFAEVPVELQDVLRKEGLAPEAFAGRVADVRPALQRALRDRATRAGEGALLEDRQLTDGFNYYAFPNTTFDLRYDGYTLLRARPHPRDPERMSFDEWDYVRAAPGSVRASAPRAFVHGEEKLSPVIEQDVTQLVQVQRGMHSRGFRGLYLGEHERRIRHMHETIDGYVGGDAPGDRTR